MMQGHSEQRFVLFSVLFIYILKKQTLNLKDGLLWIDCRDIPTG